MDGGRVYSNPEGAGQDDICDVAGGPNNPLPDPRHSPRPPTLFIAIPLPRAGPPGAPAPYRGAAPGRTYYMHKRS